MTDRRRTRLILSAVALVLVLVWIALLGGASGAWAASASWAYAPAAAPAPPPGAAPSPFPTDLGTVGDIEFWSPNQGLLITGGTSDGFVPSGLYAYDGASWHLLSTVCGSAEGRIAYVSADEWWTISDQVPGLAASDTGGVFYNAISLCHFVDGQVVGSYALPVDEADSWPVMDAAACDGPDDCWFAGGFSGTTGGAFHLYWNGSTLTEVDDTTEAHAVTSMTLSDGQLYEGVRIGADDAYSASENQLDPAVIHTLNADDLSDPFQDVPLDNFDCSGYCPPALNYGTSSSGEPVAADQFDGWTLSSDDGAVENPASAGQLWAITSPSDSNASPIALRETDGNWTDVIGTAGVQLPAGTVLGGIAAVPGQDEALVTIDDQNPDGADVDVVSSTNGGTSWTVTTDTDIGSAQGVGYLGDAGPIACPAANDCWLATTEGYLFHYTTDSGSPNATDGYSQSTDPVYNGGDGVISYRPPDGGTPLVTGTTPPPDDSLANEPPPVVLPPATPPAKTKAVALVSDEKSKLIGNSDMIEFTFKLAAKAKVQLIASRREKASGKTAKSSKAKTTLVVVARSKQQTLKKGKHAIELKLNPKRWPTSLKLDATLVKAKT